MEFSRPEYLSVLPFPSPGVKQLYSIKKMHKSYQRKKPRIRLCIKCSMYYLLKSLLYSPSPCSLICSFQWESDGRHSSFQIWASHLTQGKNPSPYNHETHRMNQVLLTLSLFLLSLAAVPAPAKYVPTSGPLHLHSSAQDAFPPDVIWIVPTFPSNLCTQMSLHH